MRISDWSSDVCSSDLNTSVRCPNSASSSFSTTPTHRKARSVSQFFRPSQTMAKRDGRVCSRQRARQAGSFECSSPMRGKHYRNKLDSWTEALRLSSDVKLEMFNEGSGPATEIEVTLRFPQIG